MREPLKRLPIKTYYKGIELFNQPMLVWICTQDAER